jgi:undecaprenyl diphosphate synthase
LKSDTHPVLDPDLQTLPAHVAIIMDGNGRWAKKQMMNRVKGHEQGAGAVRKIVSACRELGINILTLYAFSTENWGRPKAEIKALMMLLKKFIVSERDELVKQGICLNVIGQIYRLPEDIQAEIETSMALTANNSDMVLNLALSYGSREELTSAVRRIAEKIEAGELNSRDIDAGVIQDHLYTRQMPDPDLLIRTSGEYRISNFLLWQIAYTEIFISRTLWPDFTKEEFFKAVDSLNKRERRFGGRVK